MMLSFWYFCCCFAQLTVDEKAVAGTVCVALGWVHYPCVRESARFVPVRYVS